MLHERFFHIASSHLVVPKVLAFLEDAQSSLFNRLMKYSALDPGLRPPLAALRTIHVQPKPAQDADANCFI